MSAQNPGRVGAPLVISIDLSNRGTGSATDVVVTAEIPAGFEIVSGKIGWFGVPCTVVGQTLTCRAGSVPSFGFIVVEVRPTTAGSFTASIAVTSALDADLTNNSATLPLEIVAPAAA